MKNNFLTDLYAVRDLHDDELFVWRELSEFFQRYIPSDVNVAVLDLGAGRGYWNPVCGQKFAIDPRTFGGTWRDVPQHFQGVRVVFMSNFLEHLASIREIDACLKAVYVSLAKGGKAIIMGPNIRYTGPKYWDYADHKVPLTDQTVVELLRKNGYLIREWHPRFLPYSFRSSLPKWPWLVRLYLKLPFLWSIFGEQMLIIAEKPNA